MIIFHLSSLFVGHSTQTANEIWAEVSCSKTTISAENEVEAQKLANNYKVGGFIQDQRVLVSVSTRDGNHLLPHMMLCCLLMFQ